MCDQQTVLLYFLSTVAQTFAVGFGVLGAFTSYVMAKSAASLRDGSGIIKKRLGEKQLPAAFGQVEGFNYERLEIRNRFAAGDFRDAITRTEGLVEKLRKQNVQDYVNELDELELTCDSMGEALRKRRGMRLPTHGALWATVVTVALALLALPFCSRVGGASVWLVYGPALLLCPMTLAFYAWLVIAAVRDRGDAGVAEEEAGAEAVAGS